MALAEDSDRDAWLRLRPTDDLQARLWADQVQFSIPQLLRYEDRNSMAFSIETRLPFLDWRIVEFAFSLPDEQKLEGTTTKAIVRRALGDRVPASVLASEKEVAALIKNAWLSTLESGIHTADIYRPGHSRCCAGTEAFAAAVIERLGERPGLARGERHARQPYRVSQAFRRTSHEFSIHPRLCTGEPSVLHLGTRCYPSNVTSKSHLAVGWTSSTCERWPPPPTATVNRASSTIRRRCRICAQ